MTAVFGALSILALIAMVLVRVRMLARRGITAMKFGQTDTSDFAIAPFALFYCYLICANGFGLRRPDLPLFFDSAFGASMGELLCLSALCFMFLGLVSFGSSFRVGIDADKPGQLVTSGIFGVTRNPLYVAFGLMLAGQFLIQPTVLMLLYVAAGFGLFHRQVLREEAYLRGHYGEEYQHYCKRVPRYLW